MTPQALFKEAVALHQAGRLAEAEPLYRQLMAAAPGNYPTHYMFALLRHQQQRAPEALMAVEIALKINPNAANALALRGVLLQQAGRHDAALESFTAVTLSAPGDARAWYNRATMLQSLGRLDDALAGYEQALALQPEHGEALYNRALILSDLKRGSDALVAMQAAMAFKTNDADAWKIFGVMLQGAAQLTEALTAYDRSLALESGDAEVWSNRGTVLLDLKRAPEALASLERALVLRPDSARIWYNRGTAFKDLKRNSEALTSYDRALAIDPDLTPALNSRSAVRWTEKQCEGAIQDLEKLVTLDPNYEFAQGLLLHLKMHTGDWRDFDQAAETVNQGVRAGRKIVQPFVYQAIAQSPADLQACSELYADGRYPLAPALMLKANRGHRKIRLGYMSGEMRAHAIGYLMVGVFEEHDKDRFETVILDNGGSDGSPTRQRIEAASDALIDIGRMPAKAAAERIRDEEIDILVNLNGYFGSVRMDIFACRPAPLQVNYLGLPATLGARYMDYIIADDCVIPDDERRFYTESVAHLPDTYWPTDRRQAIAENIPTRAECGLPEQGFVFCNFNQSYKLTPAMFEVWARILGAVDGSVLWLLDCYDEFAVNLRRAAEGCGIAGERIIFAPHTRLDRHLARLKLADLSLDSVPYNEHTTACDVLWAGVPLITCRGTTFPGRVAASQLQAMAMPELITENFVEYEALALKLARDPGLLKSLRQKLAQNRLTTHLFDTTRFTRNLEAAYARMWESWKRGDAPTSFRL